MSYKIQYKNILSSSQLGDLLPKNLSIDLFLYYSVIFIGYNDLFLLLLIRVIWNLEKVFLHIVLVLFDSL